MPIVTRITQFSFLLLICFPYSNAQAKINIFACEPEWAALSRAIGGDELVDVWSATHERQDPHHIRARPSLIARVRRADLLFCSGGGLEEGWLPILLTRAGRSLDDQKAFMMATDYVPLLEVPAQLDRSQGHVHAMGNPHLNTSPDSYPVLAKELTRRLQALDQPNQSIYQTRLETFLNQWETATKRWHHMTSSLKRQKVITHHRSFSYLLQWLEIELIDTIEPKPGIPPTSSHLKLVLEKSQKDTPFAILRTPFEPKQGSEWIASKLNRPAIELPFTVTRGADGKDLMKLFDTTFTLLLNAETR